MKLIDTTCPSCGAKLNVDAENQKATCEFCGAALLIDDEVQHIQYDNAEEAGYNFEKGRQRAQAEAYRQNAGINRQPTQQAAKPQKKRKTWLWVLGWICIFPLPLTILMVKNQKMKKGLKIGIIAAAWILYLIIGLSGGSGTDAKETANNTTPETSTLQDSSKSGTTSEEPVNLESIADNVVNGFNKTSSSKLNYKENFAVQDKNSGHYRTEFRLTAYKDALGKSYLMDSLKVDLIVTPNFLKESDIRIYADDATLEQCKILIKNASKLLDPTMDDATINEAIKYIEENKEANGYYYGELGLLLLGNEKDGYDIMIKTD